MNDRRDAELWIICASSCTARPALRLSGLDLWDKLVLLVLLVLAAKALTLSLPATRFLDLPSLQERVLCRQISASVYPRMSRSCRVCPLSPSRCCARRKTDRVVVLRLRSWSVSRAYRVE